MEMRGMGPTPGYWQTRRSNRRAVHQGWPAGCAPATSATPTNAASFTSPAASRKSSSAVVRRLRHQLRRGARGRQPPLRTHTARVLACDQLVQRRAMRRYRSWLQPADQQHLLHRRLLQTHTGATPMVIRQNCWAAGRHHESVQSMLPLGSRPRRR